MRSSSRASSIRRRDGTGLALAVGGRRHAQDPANGLDAEAAAVLVDVAAHFRTVCVELLSENTDADLRISLARRSS
jgi:hypothetical protein